MIVLSAATALAGLGFAAPARAGDLQRDRRQARQLAAEVGALDGRIESAVRDYADATAALDTVRMQIRRAKRLRDVAQLQLDIARAALQRRAVALYKRGDVTALDAMFSATDFQQLVDQLSLVRRVTASDREIVRGAVESRRELRRRSLELEAGERAALRLVRQRGEELTSIRERLRQRTELLAGVKAGIARLAAKQARASSAPWPHAAVAPPSGGSSRDSSASGTGGTGGVAGGAQGGAWWPLIQSAAAAQGVSDRGLYRLMMIESGGSPTAIGPGGFCGLFQYAPSTWKGSWNPYRGASIYDGAAQIRATAFAIGRGHGHAWWDPSFSWAFGT